MEHYYIKINGQKTLGNLLDILSYIPQDSPIALPDGTRIASICSYRGYYEDLALVWAGTNEESYKTVGELRDALLASVGMTYIGWKGGDFPASLDTPLWVVMDSGNTGDALTGIGIEVAGDYSIQSRPEDNYTY